MRLFNSKQRREAWSRATMILNKIVRISFIALAQGRICAFEHHLIDDKAIEKKKKVLAEDAVFLVSSDSKIFDRTCIAYNSPQGDEDGTRAGADREEDEKGQEEA